LPAIKSYVAKLYGQPSYIRSRDLRNPCTKIQLLLKHITMVKLIQRIFQYISNKMQRYTVYFIWKLLYMFRVVSPPIIRSANNCI